MVNFFLRLYDMLHQRKALFTGLLLGLIMTLLVMMFSLSYNENIYDFLPLSGNEQKAINIYQDISGGQRIYAGRDISRRLPPRSITINMPVSRTLFIKICQ